MQTPTPPTKPTPPTPPSMKTSTAVPSTDTHTPTKTTSTVTAPAKEVPKTSSTDQSTLAPESKNNVPPLGSYSNSSNSAKETTSETGIPPLVPGQKSNPSSTGMTIFLVLIMFVTVGIMAIHWFKNNKPKQKSIINYSTESTDDLVDLILSQNPPDPAPQMAAKSPPKKLLLKPAAKPKNKGGFEVRI